MRGSIIRDINGLLAENTKPILVPAKGVDDTVSVRANNYALAVTRPKTAIMADFFKRIRRYYLFAMVFTAIVFAVMTLARVATVITLNDYISSVIIIGIALVFELGASIAEEWRSQQEEEID